MSVFGTEILSFLWHICRYVHTSCNVHLTECTSQSNGSTWFLTLWLLHVTGRIFAHTLSAYHKICIRIPWLQKSVKEFLYNIVASSATLKHKQQLNNKQIKLIAKHKQNLIG